MTTHVQKSILHLKGVDMKYYAITANQHGINTSELSDVVITKKLLQFSSLFGQKRIPRTKLNCVIKRGMFHPSCIVSDFIYYSDADHINDGIKAIKEAIKEWVVKMQVEINNNQAALDNYKNVANQP